MGQQLPAEGNEGYKPIKAFLLTYNFPQNPRQRWILVDSCLVSKIKMDNSTTERLVDIGQQLPAVSKGTTDINH